MASSIFIWPGAFSSNGSSVTFLVPAYFQDGTATAPGIAFASATGDGIFKNGATDIRLVTTGGNVSFGTAANQLVVGVGGLVFDVGNQDTILKRISAGVLGLQNGTALQTFQAYDATGTGFSSYGGSGISTYKNVATAGFGVPVIYASGRQTAQVAAISSLATFTPVADGSFLITANVLVTTATSHTFTMTCAYTDEGNTSRTETMTFFLVAGSALTTSITNTNGTVPYAGIPMRIRAKASTAITVATTGTFTTVAYNAEASIVQIA